MSDKHASRLALVLAFATIYVVWGSTYLGIRIAVGTMPPFVMASLRFFAAGFILLALLRLRGPLNITRRQLLDNAIVGCFLLLGGNGLVSWAEQSVPSGVTALIIGIQPLVMSLMEWGYTRRNRPGGWGFVGLLLGFGGVALLAAPWHEGGGTALDHGGVIAILAACLFWGFGSIYGRHLKSPASPFLGSALQMILGSVALGIAALLRGEWASFSPAQVSHDSWMAFVYLTLVGSLVGFSTFVWLMKHSTPPRVATYAYVNPIVAVFLGWLILGEPVGWRVAGASLVIVASVVMITLSRRATA